MTNKTCYGCAANCSPRNSGGCALGYSVGKRREAQDGSSILARFPLEQCPRPNSRKALAALSDIAA